MDGADNASASVGHWFVAQTLAREETKASDRLSKKAITTYVPRLLVRRRHASRRWQALEPLFPGYIFAQFSPKPDIIYRVRWTPGVRRLLGDEAYPTAVPNDVVEYLQGRENGLGYIKPGATLASGARVRFRNGPLIMLEGMVDRKASGADRVRVLLTLMNMPVAVEVDADVLEVT